MADVKIRVLTEDEASKELTLIDKKLADLGKTAKNVSGNQGVGSLSTGMDKLTGSVKGAGLSAMTSVIGFATLGGAVLAAGKFVTSSIKDWVAYNEEMRKLGMATGSSTEDLSRLVQAADDVGVSMEAMKTAMRMAAKNGVAPTVENLAKLSDELLKIEDETARAEAMNKIFGRGWSEVAAFVLQGGDAIRAGTAAIEDGLVVTEKSAQAARDYAMAVDGITDAWTSFRNKFASTVLPTITKALNWFSGQTEDTLGKLSKELMRSGADWSDYTSKIGDAARKAGLIVQTGTNYYGNYIRIVSKTGIEVDSLYESEYQLAVQTDLLTTAITGAADGAGDFNNELTGLDSITGKTSESVGELTSSWKTAAFMLGDLRIVSQNFAIDLTDVDSKAKKVSLSFKSMGNGIDEVKRKAAATKEAIANMFDLPDLGSKLIQNIKAMKFAEAGGLIVDALRKQIEDAMNKPGALISKEQGMKAFEGLLIADAAVKVKMGEISQWQAWNDIRNQLGLTGKAAENAKALFDKLVGMDGKTIDITALIKLIGTYTGTRNVGVGVPGAGPGGSTGQGGKAEERQRQHGGAVNTGMPYLVGERGPELMIPGSSGYVMSNRKLTELYGGMMSGMGGMTVSVTVNEASNPRATAEMVVAIINQRMRMSRNAGSKYGGA
jgi:hypothetical protein